ncbi:MAG: transcriptional regulator, partial [Candidatus Bathycorpusculaceae bacterium]
NIMTYVMLKYFSKQNRIIDGEKLIVPCEIAVKSVIPAIKALIAKQLVEEHGLKQEKVAEILGISQSAVSKYTRKVRGYVIKIDGIEEIEPLIEKMVGLLEGGTYPRREFLKIFCQTCLTIRKTRLMCQFCIKTEPKTSIEECDFCLNLNPLKRK